MYEDYFLPDYKDYTIDSIDVEFVSTVDDDGKAVSEKIRSLNIGDEVTVTLKSSERKVYSFDSLSAKNATIEYKGSGNESKVDLYVTDSPLIGMTVAEMVDAYIGCQMKCSRILWRYCKRRQGRIQLQNEHSGSGSRRV